jgi:phospholipase C
MAGSIEHVVIIVKENHTFDNYFGRFGGAEGRSLPALRIRPPMTPTTDTRRG